MPAQLHPDGVILSGKLFHPFAGTRFRLCQRTRRYIKITRRCRHQRNSSPLDAVGVIGNKTPLTRARALNLNLRISKTSDGGEISAQVRGREKNPSHWQWEEILILFFSLSFSYVTVTSLFAEERRSRRKADVSNTRANIRVHRTEHKCATSIAGFCLLRRSDVAPTNCSRDCPAWYEFSRHPMIASPFLSSLSSRHCSVICRTLLRSLFRRYTPGEKYCWLYIQGGSTHKVGGHDSNGNVDVRWREFKIEFFLTRISRVIYQEKISRLYCRNRNYCIF